MRHAGGDGGDGDRYRGDGAVQCFHRFDAALQDIASALFHLRAAADCGNMQGLNSKYILTKTPKFFSLQILQCFPPALVAIAQIYTGRPNDILPAITQLDASEHEPGNVEDVGLDFLTTAARLGDSVVDIIIIVIITRRLRLDGLLGRGIRHRT